MLRIYHRKAFRISVTKFRPGVTEIGQNATVQITGLTMYGLGSWEAQRGVME